MTTINLYNSSGKKVFSGSQEEFKKMKDNHQVNDSDVIEIVL